MQVAAFNRHQAAPTAPGANTQVSISFGESVNPDFLRQAWQAVMQRHPILRSAFTNSPEGLMIRETDKAEPTWISLDWQSAGSDEISTKWNALLASDAVDEFQVIAVPLVRFHDIRLPGGGGHYLLSTPSFLLDEFSLTRVLLDLLLILGQSAIAPAGELPEISKAKRWNEFLVGATIPMALESRTGNNAQARASLLLDREKSTNFSKFCLDNDLEEGVVIRCLWSLLLRRFGANGNLMLCLFDGRGESSEAGYYQNWLPLVHSWEGSVRDWLDSAQALTDLITENVWIDPDEPLRDAGMDFGVADISTAFRWRTTSINDIIHTALPRWINFDAQLQQKTSEGLMLEARSGPRLELTLSGPFSNEFSAKQILSRLVGMMVELPGFYEKPVSRLPVLISEEIQAIRGWSRGPELTEQPSSVPGAFRKVVLNHAESPAVCFRDYSMSYAELDALSDKLASHLAHLGLAGGWHVGIVLSPSAWIGVALMGCWKAGNSCLVIDATAPQDWIESTLFAQDAAAVVCDASSEAQVDGTHRRRIVIDQNWETLEIGHLGEKIIQPDDLAATIPGHVDGQPPLVRALTHNMLVSAAAEGARILDFKAGDTFLMQAVPGGGAFLDEWIVPLLSGGTVHVADEDLLEPVTAPVTHIRMTTPEWSNQAAAWARGGNPASHTLRVVAIEAGAPTITSAKIWAQQNHPPIKSIVFFSPVGLCGMGLWGNARRDTAFLPVGKPTAEIEVLVCDADGLDLPVGYAGSVFLKFPGWKNLPDAAGRHGINLGLNGWRDAQGDLHLESAARHVNGLPTFPQKIAALPFLDRALDIFIGKAIYLLSDESPAGTIAVKEWLLNRDGWIDESALPQLATNTAPTPATIAKTSSSPTRRPSKEAWSPVSMMQAGTGGELLVLVHGADGSPDIYRDLIRALGPSRRILGLTARGVENAEACHPSIESAAAQYIASIFEDERPESWKLVGFGFGGMLALEMARQLQAAERKLPGLVILGAFPPIVDRPVSWFSSMKRVFKKSSPIERMEPLPPRTETAVRHEMAWKNYRLPACQVPATCVLGVDVPVEIAASWQEVLPHVTIEFTKSNSADMLSYPAVKRIASIINSSEAPELF